MSQKKVKSKGKTVWKFPSGYRLVFGGDAQKKFYESPAAPLRLLFMCEPFIEEVRDGTRRSH